MAVCFTTFFWNTCDFNKIAENLIIPCYSIHERSEVNDEMARDEARHGKAFEGLLKRYFG